VETATRAPAISTKARYVPRGRNQLHAIFDRHLQEFCDVYDEKYAAKYGLFRLERIRNICERFLTCGDYRRGVARIRCTNPACGHDYFRPFSCKGFYLCPSCSQKRTLLFAEHLTNDVLLELPHRQFVFTMPKALRPFFRHDRRLFAEVSRLIYTIITEFYEDFVQNLLSWKNSGFSIDNSVRLTDAKSKESLTEYIARPPLSLKKIRYEPFKGKVLFHTKYSEYFGENTHLFDALEFLAELTQHVPPRRVQLIRRYGLYSSRTKGRWSQMPHVAARAPEGWRASHAPEASVPEVPGFEPLDDGEEVTVDARKRAWARLLAKVYEIDPLVCPKCGSEMKVIAVIQDPVEIRDILTHLVKAGRAPPGLDPTVLN
jgi:hypothetical protein